MPSINCIRPLLYAYYSIPYSSLYPISLIASFDSIAVKQIVFLILSIMHSVIISILAASLVLKEFDFSDLSSSLSNDMELLYYDQA